MDKINFSNLPSTTTPVNATNMNQLQTNVDNGKIDKTLTTLNTVDLNTVKETGFNYCSNCTNRPVEYNGYLVVLALNSNTVLQTYYRYNYDEQYLRRCTNGIWQNWIEMPYEINGTWIPVVTTRNNVAPTATYSAQTGTYKKIGNMVFITFLCRGKITALNDTNNYGVIAGLPFKPKAYSGYGQCAISPAVLYNLTVSTDYPTFMVRDSYDGQIYIQHNNGASATTLKVSGDNNFQVGGSGWYEIA